MANMGTIIHSKNSRRPPITYSITLACWRDPAGAAEAQGKRCIGTEIRWGKGTGDHVL